MCIFRKKINADKIKDDLHDILESYNKPTKEEIKWNASDHLDSQIKGVKEKEAAKERKEKEEKKTVTIQWIITVLIAIILGLLPLILK